MNKLFEYREVTVFHDSDSSYSGFVYKDMSDQYEGLAYMNWQDKTIKDEQGNAIKFNPKIFKVVALKTHLTDHEKIVETIDQYLKENKRFVNI
jgi:hypothetical protein